MTAFDWHDGERVVHFGRGRVAEAPRLLGDGYVLLTTGRGRSTAPGVADAAAAVFDVGPGLVDRLAEELLGVVPADAGLIVGLGGGRVIDTAKAVAAVRGVRAGAIPTTLSAAEMTWLHRLPASAPPGTAHVRPAIVVNDPALSASQPPGQLAASAANSLAHAIEGAVTTRSNPVARLEAGEAIRLTARAYAGDPSSPDARDDLALAALLSGAVIDSAWYGLHHVLAQTAVRVGGAGHGPANAALLPHTASALRDRGADVSAEAIDLARRLAERAGAARLRDVGVAYEALDACADAAAARPELDHTPPRAGREAIRAIYEAAW
jgi:alcohol dehydrogenase class IV